MGFCYNLLFCCFEGFVGFGGFFAWLVFVWWLFFFHYIPYSELHLASFFSCTSYRMLCRKVVLEALSTTVVPFQGSREILSMKICSTFYVLHMFTQASKSLIYTWILPDSEDAQTLSDMNSHRREDIITFLPFHWAPQRK